MGSRALENRIKRLQELEAQKAALDKEIASLKEEIKEDMQDKGTDEIKTGNFIIRWKSVVNNKFDTKAFQKEHESLYNQYLKKTESKRFTIA